MALSDKQLLIVPNVGQTADPKIVFSGADASTAAQNITLQVYPTNGGTLSFEGSTGQLFSIANTMTGTIFSANDVSGIPSIEILDTGLIKLGQYGGNVVLGSGTDLGWSRLQAFGLLSTGNGTAPGVGTGPRLGQIHVESTDAYTTQYGGRISFGGQSGTSTYVRGVFATIEAYKTNASNNNTGGGLDFYTSVNDSGAVTKRLRIDGEGTSTFYSTLATTISGAGTPASFSSGGNTYINLVNGGARTYRIYSADAPNNGFTGFGIYDATASAWRVKSDSNGIWDFQSGGVTVVGSGVSNIAPLLVQTTSAGTGFTWSTFEYNSSLPSGNNNLLHMIGVAAGTNNCGYMGFNYAGGSGSSSNFLTFGLYGNDHILNIQGTGNVGIGVGAPGVKLDVMGDLRLQGGNQNIYFNNTLVQTSITQQSGSVAALGFDGNIVFTNGRKGLVGQYDASQTQAIFAMGSSYVLTNGGASNVYGSFYGIAWSYNPDYGGAGNNPQSKAGLTHQALFMVNGVTTTAIGAGIWTGGAINATGDITAYASDERLKENITPISNAVDKVKAIRGINYNWNDLAGTFGYENKEIQVGVLAQDVQKVLPEIVVPAPFDDNNGISKSGENYLTVKYEKLTPLLIEAIKEQASQIELLQQQVKSLLALVENK